MSNDSDKLNALTAVQLREVGRRYGVKSPSSKSKQELIDQILAIEKGELAPTVSRRGRPIKSRNFDNWREDDGRVKNDSYIMLKLSDVVSNYHTVADRDGIEVEGFIKLNKSGYAILTDGNLNETRVYVPITEVTGFGLLSGDYVKGRAVQTEDKSIDAMFAIDSVNGKPTDAIRNRNRFHNEPTCDVSEELRFDTKQNTLLQSIDMLSPVALGERVAFYCESRGDVKSTTEKLVNGLKSSGLKTVVCLSDFDQDVIHSMEFNDFGLNNNIEATALKQIEAADFSAEKCRRYAEEGISSVLVFNMGRFINACKLVFGAFNAEGVEKAKRILSSGRKLASGISITVFAVISENMRSELIEEEFTSEIYIPFGYNVINPCKSFSGKIEKFKTKNEIDAIRKLRTELLENSNPLSAFQKKFQ